MVKLEEIYDGMKKAGTVIDENFKKLEIAIYDSGWVDVTGPVKGIQVRRIGKEVKLKGTSIVNESTSATVFVLPKGLRPSDGFAYDLGFQESSTGHRCILFFNKDGNVVVLYNVKDNAPVIFNGISWFTDEELPV